MYTINPDRNKPWNELPILPPEEEYYKRMDIMEQLLSTRIALAKLKEQSDNLPNPGVMVSSITLQEAMQSSAIENIFTTNDALYKAFSQTVLIEEGPAKEVLRYREAIFNGLTHLKDRPLNLDLIIDIYQTIKNTGNNIREHEVWITSVNPVTKERTRAYTPPLSRVIIEDKLNNLIEFLQDDERYPIDPVLKMIIGHAQFEAIHPFEDGNGRTGRILNILTLTHKEVLTDSILYMSRLIFQTKNDYYYHLGNVTRTGDWKSWISYMLDAVRETSYDTYDKVSSIRKSMFELQTELDNTSLKSTFRLVEKLYSQPFTTVKHITKSKENPYGLYAENTARNYLDKLAATGFLEKVKIEGNNYYKNRKLTEILEQ